jgi:hypothetical protein
VRICVERAARVQERPHLTTSNPPLRNAAVPARRGATSCPARIRPEAKDICARARSLPIRVNGQLAVVCYGEDADTARHLPLAIDVLTLEGALIK